MDSVPVSDFVTFLRAKGAKEDTIRQLGETEYNSIETLKYMEHNAVEKLSLSTPQTRLLLRILSDMQSEGMKRPQNNYSPKSSQSTSKERSPKMDIRLDTELCIFLREKGVRDDIIQKIIRAEYESVEALRHMTSRDVAELSLSKSQECRLLDIVSNLQCEEEKRSPGHRSSHQMLTEASRRVSVSQIKSLSNIEFVTFLRIKGVNDETIQKIIDADYDSVETLRYMEDTDIADLGLSKPQSRLVLGLITNLRGTGCLEPQTPVQQAEVVKFLRSKAVKENTIQKLIEAEYDSIETLKLAKESDIEELCLSKPQFRLVMSIVSTLDSSVETKSQDDYLHTDFVKFLRKKGIKDDTIQKLIDEEYDSFETLRVIEESDVTELRLSKAQFRLLLNIVLDLDSAEHKGSRGNPQLFAQMPVSQTGEKKLKTSQEADVVKFLRSKAVNENTIQKLIEAEYDSIEILQLAEEGDIKELCLSKPQFRLVMSIVSTLDSRVETKSQKNNELREAAMAIKPNIETTPDTEFVTYLRKKGAKDGTIRTLIDAEYDSVETLRHMEKSDIDELGISKPQSRLLSDTVANLQNKGCTMQEKSVPRNNTQAAFGYDTTQQETLPDTEFAKFLRDKEVKDDTIHTLLTEEYDSFKTLKLMKPNQVECLNVSQAQMNLILSIVTELNSSDQSTSINSRPSQKQSGEASKESPSTLEQTGTVGGSFRQETGLDVLNNYLEEVGVQNKHLQEERIHADNMRIVKFPVKQDLEDKKGKIRRCITGNVNLKHQHKTILVMGATGTGKSTLIDSLVNYILGTRWEDKHRIRLIDQHADDAANAREGQSKSQTEWITIYTIPYGKSTKISFTLYLIDTPGFGDTRGIKRDEELVKQIEALFKRVKDYNIDSIDAVCFVVNASEARLTKSQIYIFDSVLSVFGKDFKNNIITMLTFADGQTPAVMGSLKASGLEYAKYFKFNNSALLANNDGTDPASQIFWDMSSKSFKSFFDVLEKLSPTSLSLTKEVLEKRGLLKETLKYLETKMQEGLDILSTLEKDKETLENFKGDDIDENECNFKGDDIDENECKHETTEFFREKEFLPHGIYSNYCHICENTCHPVCTATKAKYFCEIFTWLGYCTRCRGECSTKKHERVNYRFVNKQKTVTKTNQSLFQKYKEDAGIKSNNFKEAQKSIIAFTEEKLRQHKTECQNYTKRCTNIVKEIGEIALRPYPMTGVEYLQELIAAEKCDHKKGWEGRVRELEKLIKHAQILVKPSK